MNNSKFFQNYRAINCNQFVENWIFNYDYFINQLPKLLVNIANKNLIVIGSGTGNEIETFMQSSKKWNITGVDPPPEMLSQAREQFKDIKNINLVNGCVSNLPLDKKFDAATLLLVLYFLKEDEAKLNLLKNIKARMNFGASFILLDITGSKNKIKKNLQTLKSPLPSSLDREQVNIRLERIENKLFYISENRLSELLVQVGFEVPLRFFNSQFTQDL